MVLLLLMGCRRQVAVSPRLVELDSLIAVAPDSAAALLAAIPADSLTDPENRAYHALLLTQAKYKAYIPAYSLDTINLAVQQYSDGHDPEKQTCSILYKGCVFEELPQIDSAMYYYKAAEDLATQSGDTYHRGYALMRQAWLYHGQFDSERAISLYRSALDSFETPKDDKLTLQVLNVIASLYITIDKDSAQLFGERAMQLCLSSDRKDFDYCSKTLADIYFVKHDYRQCIELAKKAIANTQDRQVNFHCHQLLAQAFAYLGSADSSRYYLKMSSSPANKQDSVMLLTTQSVIAASNQDNLEALELQLFAGNMADTIIIEKSIQPLDQAAHDYQASKMASDHKMRLTRVFRLISALAVLLFLLVGIAFAFWQKRKKLDAVTKQNEINKLYLELKEISQRSESLSQQNKELSQENEELQALAKKVQQTESDLSTDKDYANLENERLKEKQLSKSLEYIAGLLHTFIQQSHELKPSEFTEKFRKGFLETPNGGEVDFWYTLRVQADQVHGGAVERLLAEHPDLNEKSIRVLCMSALGFSTEMMATCLQHKSGYINTLKNRLKKKLDINCSIPDYLKQLGETR